MKNVACFVLSTTFLLFTQHKKLTRDVSGHSPETHVHCHHSRIFTSIFVALFTEQGMFEYSRDRLLARIAVGTAPSLQNKRLKARRVCLRD